MLSMAKRITEEFVSPMKYIGNTCHVEVMGWMLATLHQSYDGPCESTVQYCYHKSVGVCYSLEAGPSSSFPLFCAGVMAPLGIIQGALK